MIFFRQIWLLLLLGLVGIENFAQAAPKGTISQITMQRTWCYGACPIDSLTLSVDGTASYSGVSIAPRLGRFNGKVAPERFARLAAWLEEQNFFELRPEIGVGNIDASDLIVHVVRDGVPYFVAFRFGDESAIGKKMQTAIAEAASEIIWKKDEASSASGVHGTARRTLTPNEVRIFSDRKPPITSVAMQFAIVKLRVNGDAAHELTTITDQEGRFEFLVPPGRHSLTSSSFDDYNGARPLLAGPRWFAKPNSVTVEATKFAPVTLQFIG